MSKKYSTEHNITNTKFETDEDKVTSRYITYPNKTGKRQAEGGLRLQNKFKKSLVDKPLVTVITVCFNSEKYLERCILSVLNQTYNNIEYIIIDGGSTDKTLDIIKKYQNAIDYYISEPDDGIYFAMNKGLELASGDYIAMLNSDDWFYKHGLSAIFNNEDKKYKDVIITTKKTYNLATNTVESVDIPKIIDNSVYLSSAPCHQATIYSKNIANKFGYYDTNYKIVADWDIFLKVFDNLGNDSISYSYSLLTYFSSGGLSSSPTEESYILHINERMQIFKKYFPELSHEDLEILKVAYWENTDKIYKHFFNFSEQQFSTKFVNVLHDFLILKSDVPYANKGNIKKPFLEQNSKYYMIEKLKNLKPLEIPYKEDENKIVVFFASDRNYEPHLWVAISSLIDSSSEKINYYIYILDGGISYKENFYKLTEDKNNIKIFFIDMKEQFCNTSETKHLTKAAYYRLAVYNLFADFKRILYIDADSYILSDLYPLYSMEMTNNLIAAAKDSITWQKSFEQHIDFLNFSGTWIDYELKYIGHSRERMKKYFNSGIMLFNFENTEIEYKTNILYRLLKNDYYSHDQDILNLLYSENEIKILNREWNYFNICSFLPESEYLSYEEKENYMNMKVEPKIISYILKPWTYQFCKSDFSELYWNKLKHTPYLHEVQLKLEVDKLKNHSSSIIHKSSIRKRTFLEYIFSVYTHERFIEIYILGVKISIKRKNK